jgi:hypothetical protein
LHKSELFNIEQQIEKLNIHPEQLEKITIQKQLEQFSLENTFLQSSTHFLKQHLIKKKNIIYKQILEEEKKIIDYEIRKNNYIIYISPYIETNFKKELILVHAKYPIKHI